MDIRNGLIVLEQYMTGKNDLGLSQVTNENLRKLLTSMLDINPKKRPNILTVMILLNFC